MTNAKLIQLLQQLKEKNLKISQQKAKVLTSLSDEQVDAFLLLLDANLIDQSNINYAIGEISKIKNWEKFNDMDINIDLYHSSSNQKANRDALKLIFTWCKEGDIENFSLLDDIFKEDAFFLTRDGVMDVLLNKKLLNNQIMDDILEWYIYVFCYFEDLPETSYNEFLRSANQYILEEDILKYVLKECSYTHNSYTETLGLNERQFFTVFIVENLHTMLLGLIQNKKLKINVCTLMNQISSHPNVFIEVENIQDLYSILMQTNPDKNDFDYILRIMQSYYQEKGHDFQELVESIYDNQTKSNHANLIFRKVIKVMNYPLGILDIADVFPIIESLPNFEKLSIIEIEWILEYMDIEIQNCGEQNIGNYINLMKEIKELGVRENYKLLGKIIDMGFHFARNKAVMVLSQPDVFELVSNDLTIASIIVDCAEMDISDAGLSLLMNPKFLSSKYLEDFIDLVDRVTDEVDGKNLDADQFYLAFSKFDFDDPNLDFYANNLLSYNNAELEKIAKRKNKNSEKLLTTISDCVYDSLIHNDSDSYQQLISILEYLDPEAEMESETKVVYQKKKK